jgi:hypothetical protein
LPVFKAALFTRRSIFPIQNDNKNEKYFLLSLKRVPFFQKTGDLSHFSTGKNWTASKYSRPMEFLWQNQTLSLHEVLNFLG